MPNSCYIYALVDSLNPDDIRYIGQTVLTLPKRLKRHINSCAYETTHKTNWIKKILKEGRSPEIKVIEVTDSDLSICDAREIYWISYYKSLGCRLTNASLGGHGVRWSEEMKRKASKARKGIAPSLACQKAAKEARTGSHHTDDAREKMSKNRKGIPAWNKGVPVSEEEKQRLQTLTVGYQHTEDSKKKISESSKERWQDDKMKEKIKKGQRKAWEDLELRTKMGEFCRERWKDEDYRAKVSKAMKEAWKRRKEKKK